MKSTTKTLTDQPYFEVQFSTVKGLVLLCVSFFVYVLGLSLSGVDYVVFWQLLCFLIPGAVALKFLKLKNAFSTHRMLKNSLFVLILSCVVTCGVNFISAEWEKLFPLPEAIQDLYRGLFHIQTAWGIYRDIFCIAFIPAVAEEIVFRGFLLTTILKYVSQNIAIVVCALIFALFHMNLWHLPFLFILGLFFSFVYIRTKNLGLAILAHFINNLIGVVLYYHTGHI